MRILVVGCGYLGLRTAQIWVGQKHEVHAVTRSGERAAMLEQQGITPVIADITRPDSLSDFPSVDVVMFAVGFDRSLYNDIREVYVDGLQNVLNRLQQDDRVGQFVYISSTGVYGNFDGDWVTEESLTDPQRPGGLACLEAERLIRASHLGSAATILRLAGIYGPDRIPRLQAITTQNWESLAPSGHVNLIHVQDAAQVTVDIVAQKQTGELLLVADGAPPLRKDFYQFVADELRAGPIDWSMTTTTDAGQRAAVDKRISNQKLVKSLNYKFSFPDYKSGVQNAIERSSSSD